MKKEKCIFLLRRYARIPLEIIELLERKRHLNISEIQRELGISYKETWRHLKDLELMGIIHKQKMKNIKHNEARIRLI